MRESSKTTHERRTRESPVLSAMISMLGVDTNVDKNAKDDKDDDCYDFQRRQPIFCGIAKCQEACYII